MIAIVGLTASAEANTSRFFSATDCLGSVSADNNILGRFKEGRLNFFPGPPSYDFTTNLCGPAATVSLPITATTAIRSTSTRCR